MRKTTKKTTPKKASEAAAKKIEAQQMDPSVREVLNPEPAITRQRVCYAALTFAAEFLGLFPETSHEFASPNGRGVALEVALDLTTLDDDTQHDMKALLTILTVDDRVNSTVMEDGLASVLFNNNPRTYDQRDAFDLKGAWLALIGDDEMDDVDESDYPEEDFA